MKGRNVGRLLGLWLLAVVLSCVSVNYFAEARPEPIQQGFIYPDSFADDTESFLLLQRLKQIAERKHEVIEQERELDDEQIVIQAMLEAEARKRRISQPIQTDFSAEDAEILPIPSAVVHHEPVHSGKRTSYMTLCHFKICNMGRKRQL